MGGVSNQIIGNNHCNIFSFLYHHNYVLLVRHTLFWCNGQFAIKSYTAYGKSIVDAVQLYPWYYYLSHQYIENILTSISKEQDKIPNMKCSILTHEIFVWCKLVTRNDEIWDMRLLWNSPYNTQLQISNFSG